MTIVPPYFVALAASLVSLAIAFWHPLAAWVPILLFEGYSRYVLRGVRRMPVPELANLSPMAKELLRAHPHFYSMPWAGDAFRKAVSLTGTVGLAVGVVGAVRGTWTGLAIAVANVFAMIATARAFNPTGYLAPGYEQAHDELIDRLAALEKQR